MDRQMGIFVDLIECRLREGVFIHDLKAIGNMDILSVISSEGNKHICLVQGHQAKETTETFFGEQLNLIYTAPSLISEDKIIVSFISSHRDMTRFVEIVKEKVGKVVNMTFKQSTYERKELLSVLTEKQREVMSAAYRHGYYDIPRRIGSEELAEKLEMSKPTLMEHMRKAERRIFMELMEGSPETEPRGEGSP
jgi:predicted DNA binding protein